MHPPAPYPICLLRLFHLIQLASAVKGKAHACSLIYGVKNDLSNVRTPISTANSTWREERSNPFIDVIDVDALDDGVEEHEAAPQSETSESESDGTEVDELSEDSDHVSSGNTVVPDVRHGHQTTQGTPLSHSSSRDDGPISASGSASGSSSGSRANLLSRASRHSSPLPSRTPEFQPSRQEPTSHASTSQRSTPLIEEPIKSVNTCNAFNFFLLTFFLVLVPVRLQDGSSNNPCPHNNPYPRIRGIQIIEGVIWTHKLAQVLYLAYFFCSQVTFCSGFNWDCRFCHSYSPIPFESTRSCGPCCICLWPGSQDSSRSLQRLGCSPGIAVLECKYVEFLLLFSYLSTYHQICKQR